MKEISTADGYPVKSLTVGGVDIGEFVITTNGSASSTVSYAASELQKYIALSVGVTLPVCNEGVPAGTKRILIDETAVPEGGDYIFRFCTDGDGLVIGGDPVRGCMYSVYHFLEKMLNWRFFASDTEVCYGGDRIDLADIDYTYKHPYKLRDIYFYDYNKNPAFCVKRYINGDSADKSSFGGNVCYTPLGIHNFGTLSETGNGCSPNPCLNSETVRAAMLKNIRAFLKDHPNAPYVQISQNDTDERCQCEVCKADAEIYGAPSATIVKAMNYLAEQLHEEYPDLLLVTFAYRYSVFAPENIECHPNVVIEFTPIDMCRRHPISHDCCNFGDNEYTNSTAPCNMTDNRYLMEAIEKWKKVSKKFCLYDYGLDCGYYYTPYPDMDSLYENYRVFNTLGAIGYANLSNPHIPSVEFGSLRGYLTLKLLEEQDMTREGYENHINEFLRAYYGPAWTVIREYFDFIHTLAARHNKCYTGYNSPEQIFGDHAFAPYSDQLVEWFDQAEALTAGNETQLLHVRRLRISMDWVRIGSIHYAEMHSGDEARVQAMTEEVEELYHRLLALGANWISEVGRIPEITDFSVNPRKWGTIRPHVQIYNE